MLTVQKFMLKIVTRKLRFNNFQKIFWYFLKNRIFLVIKTKTGVDKYICVPHAITLSKISNVYYVNDLLPSIFYSLITKWLEHLIKPLQKKLYFKGLGFKFKYSNLEKNKLELKLGYSHKTTILIPKKQIQVFLIKKNRLAIEGHNYSIVGSFAQKLKMLRFPDSYNGKGFWYKNEVISLKQIKKT